MHNPALKRRGLIADINMIPLIDVTLILLIIFMVMTPLLLQSQISVKLPETAQRGTGAENPVSLQITQKGQILLNGKGVKKADLEKKLALVLGKASQKTVLVQADRSVSIEDVVGVLDVARKLGAVKMGIGVEEK